jgi:hypothetical protein
MTTLSNNPRHEKFAQALARGMSASAAYVEAGYKSNRHQHWQQPERLLADA